MAWVQQKALKDPPGDPFDVTGDGVCHQLYGGDQETPGQEQSGGDLRSGLQLV